MKLLGFCLAAGLLAAAPAEAGDRVEAGVAPARTAPDSRRFVPLKALSLAPGRFDEAVVETAGGAAASRIRLEIEGLKPPGEACKSCLVGVVWVVDGSGRAHNIGAIPNGDGDAEAELTTPLREFVVMVTDEPHFAVKVPCGLPILAAGSPPGPRRPRVALPMRSADGAGCPNGIALRPNDPWAPMGLRQARLARHMAKETGRDEGLEFERAEDLYLRSEIARVRGPIEDADRFGRLAVQAYSEAGPDAQVNLELLARLRPDDLRDALGEGAPRFEHRGLAGRIVELFPNGEVELSPAAAARLAEFAETFLADPNALFDVTGHADAAGSRAANAEAARERAAAVYRHLRAVGVPELRIVARSMGDEDPEADNDTEAGRQRNRRVVVEVHLAPDEAGPDQ